VLPRRSEIYGSGDHTAAGAASNPSTASESEAVMSDEPQLRHSAVDAHGPPYLTVEGAAVHLSTTPTALRARCRRHARRVGRDVVARLGAGVVAYKFGVSWRLRIDPP
jgi:hypothetical protein